MGTESLFFGILAIVATVTQAYPAGDVVAHPTSTHHSSSHHASYKISTPTTKAPKSSPGKHGAASPDPTSASSASAVSAIYAADAAGPPTTLDAVQIQDNKEEAQIVANGLSLYYAGTASTASVASASAAAVTAPIDCNDGTWALTLANYNNASTDQNLKKWWFGGQDTDNNTFPAKNYKTSFLTVTLAADFMPVGSDFVCTLESHVCNPAADCNNYNVHLGNTIGHTSHWAWFAIRSIANIFSFAESFQTALIFAGVDNSFETLDVASVFTKPSHNPDLLLREILIGFSALAVAVFTFIPVVGEIVAAGATLAYDVIGYAGGTAAAAIGNGAGLFATILAGATTLDTKAAAYGAFMASAFNNTASGIDSLVSAMMQGNNGDFTGGTPLIFDVLAGGGWVNSDVITSPKVSQTALTNLLQKDLLQRGINFIWGQSKIYVTFANLNDDAQGTKCKADLNGWQASKTCLDGGVYYLYRFNEAGNEDGNLDYPWGADKMQQAPWNLNPAWVTHSSATAYRSQNNGVGGFAYDYSKQPTNLPSLFEAVGQSGFLENLNALEGVWNLSVCDMGTHSDWNADFTQTPIRTTNKDGLKFIFPCCCGPQCSQTADFVRSAQMENLDTLYNTCKKQLALCDAWPPGVTVIDFGEAGTITKQTPSGNTCVFNADY